MKVIQALRKGVQAETGMDTTELSVECQKADRKGQMRLIGCCANVSVED